MFIEMAYLKLSEPSGIRPSGEKRKMLIDSAEEMALMTKLINPSKLNESYASIYMIKAVVSTLLIVGLTSNMMFFIASERELYKTFERESYNQDDDGPHYEPGPPPPKPCQTIWIHLGNGLSESSLIKLPDVLNLLIGLTCIIAFATISHCIFMLTMLAKIPKDSTHRFFKHMSLKFKTPTIGMLFIQAGFILFDIAIFLFLLTVLFQISLVWCWWVCIAVSVIAVFLVALYIVTGVCVNPQRLEFLRIESENVDNVHMQDGLPLLI